MRVLLSRLRFTLADLDVHEADPEVRAAFNVVIAYLEEQMVTKPVPRAKPPKPAPERPRVRAPKQLKEPKPSSPPKQPAARPTRLKPARPTQYGSLYGPDGLIRIGPPQMVEAANGKPISKTIRDRLHAAKEGRAS